MIAAGAKNEFSHAIPYDGTLQSVHVRFYPGQQKSLQIQPQVKFKNEEWRSIISYAAGSDQYLSGDDDRLDYAIGFEVGSGDTIVIQVTNTDTVNAYSLVLDIEIDYLAGKKRVI